MKQEYTGNRDPRLVRVQRGGLLDDETHHSLALWAASCAERVLRLFEQQRPDDPRPSEAIGAARAWARGEISMMRAREFAYAAHDAARECTGPASDAARAAGHAVATAHMADHELGAAYYALKAITGARPDSLQSEREWQKAALSPDIRELVLDDMQRRSKKFHDIFAD